MKNMQVLKKELIEKAMHCKNAEELMALAESEGITLTKEEAEAYLAEMEDVELDGEMLSKWQGEYVGAKVVMRTKPMPLMSVTPTILPGSIASRAILRWLCQVALSS